MFDTDEIRFSGTCPYCHQDTPFKLCRISQNLGAGLYTLGTLLVSPLKAMQELAMEKAKLGSCSACDAPALQCPRCGSINRREYAPTSCINCGKEYVHP
jgi:hypothetical protein